MSDRLWWKPEPMTDAAIDATEKTKRTRIRTRAMLWAAIVAALAVIAVAYINARYADFDDTPIGAHSMSEKDWEQGNGRI